MRSLGQRIFAKSEKVGVQGRGLQVFILEVGENNCNQEILERSSTFGKNASALFQVIFQVLELPGRSFPCFCHWLSFIPCKDGWPPLYRNCIRDDFCSVRFTVTCPHFTCDKWHNLWSRWLGEKKWENTVCMEWVHQTGAIQLLLRNISAFAMCRLEMQYGKYRKISS